MSLAFEDKDITSGMRILPVNPGISGANFHGFEVVVPLLESEPLT